MRYIRTALLVLLPMATVGSGCYRYVPGDLADVGVGSQIRATLTPEQTQRMRTLLATGDTLVEGTVTASGSQGFDVRVAGVELPRQRPNERLYQTVSLNRADLLGVEFRELDRRRTLLAAVGAPLLGGIIVAGIWEWTHSRDEGEFPGGDEARIPVLLRIPIPFGRP